MVVHRMWPPFLDIVPQDKDTLVETYNKLFI